MMTLDHCQVARPSVPENDQVISNTPGAPDTSVTRKFAGKDDLDATHRSQASENSGKDC
jgi:hypothetical protein